jgi:hypothetical protein
MMTVLATPPFMHALWLPPVSPEVPAAWELLPSTWQVAPDQPPEHVQWWCGVPMIVTDVQVTCRPHWIVTHCAGPVHTEQPWDGWPEWPGGGGGGPLISSVWHCAPT